MASWLTRKQNASPVLVATSVLPVFAGAVSFICSSSWPSYISHPHHRWETIYRCGPKLCSLVEEVRVHLGQVGEGVKVRLQLQLVEDDIGPVMVENSHPFLQNFSATHIRFICHGKLIGSLLPTKADLGAD